MLINFKKIAIWLLFGLLFVVTVWVDDFSRRRVLSGFDDAAAIMSVYFFDQTTPNMIQRIIGIFERKPLISKEI